MLNATDNNNMLDYPAKIIMALAMSLDDDGHPFRQWLFDNGYTELAALSDAIKGNRSASKWLMDNKFYHLAAFDAVLDDNEDAKKWLQKFNYPILIILSDAVNQNVESIRWLKEHELDAYIILSQKIRKALFRNTSDPHKMNF